MMEDSPDEEFFCEVVSPLQKSLINASIDEIKDILCDEHDAYLPSESDDIIEYKEIAQVCLDLKVNGNLQETKYSAILHFVPICQKDRLDKVNFSLKYGADLFSTECGSTTLHKVVLGSNLDLVDLLLYGGLDINVKGALNSGTPLNRPSRFMVCRFFNPRLPKFNGENRTKGFVDMIEFLTDNGADFYISDPWLSLPVTCSNSVNILEISECLLELKANVDIRFAKYLFFCSLSTGDDEAENNSRSSSLELLVAFSAMKAYDIVKYANEHSIDRKEFEWIEPFFKNCETEVNEMKRRKICRKRNISFFNFLSKDLMEVVRFCRCAEIMLILETDEYKKEFPSYEYLLKKRVERVQLLRNYLNVLQHFLTKIFNKEFPSVVLDTIISFLDAGNLRNFGRALRITKDFPNGRYCI